MKDDNTEYFGPAFLESLASDSTPTSGGQVSFLAPWTCPKCGRVYAGWVATCTPCNDSVKPLPNVGTPADVPADGNGGAPDLAQTFAAREARDAVEQPSVEPPSAEAVAWLRELAQWLDCRCGDKQEKQRLGCQLACREYRFVADILRYVENAPRNAHRPDNSAMHPDGRIGGTR